MDLDKAQEIAERELRRIEREISVELTVTRVIERPSGWVFMYRAKDETQLLAGNAPIYIRIDGTVHYVPTRPPLQQRIEELERSLNQ